MCSPDELAVKARMKVRDFPQFFEVPYVATPMYTIRCPHPNVDPALLVVWHPDGQIVDSSEYTVDGRNGLVKLKDPTAYQDGIGLSGYFYEWFMPEDLAYASGVIFNQHLFDNDKDPATIPAAECDLIATGGIAQAMYSLLAEWAADIDVSTPEGMMIPAHQRFQQMWEMAGWWFQQYKDQAAMMGVGIYAFEQFTLRRIAYLTNRYVPILIPREVDDPRPPKRVLMPAPTGTMETDGSDIVIMPEPPSIAYGGWGGIGMSGAP